MYIDAVKEFYASLTLVPYKKKEVARSRVRGVDIEFDSLRLASILGVPGNNGICEYIKEVWEESKYTKTLEITRKFANDDLIMAARRVGSAEMKPFQSGENRRRDDEEVAPAENEAVNEEEQNPKFDSEVVVDEAALQGESRSDDQFYDAQVEKETEAAGVDPLGPTGSIPDSIMGKLQVEFERARVNRIQADLEKAQAENARHLALLRQAQSQPKP
ncbi:hypothetical protein Dimus_003929 [Dionaea muscipula]